MVRFVCTPEQLSEQVGNGIASTALNAMLNAPDQAQRVAILQTALIDLQRLPHHVEAAGGFAVGLVAVLEIWHCQPAKRGG